jgi:hypothetical protein
MQGDTSSLVGPVAKQTSDAEMLFFFLLKIIQFSISRDLNKPILNDKDQEVILHFFFTISSI